MGYFVSLAGMPLFYIWFKLSLPSASPCIASWPYWLWQTLASVLLDAQRGGSGAICAAAALPPPLVLHAISVLVAMSHLVTIWFFVLCICAYGTPSGIGGYGAGHTEGSHYCCTLITSTDMWLCHHGAFPIPIVFIRTWSIWPALTHALVDARSCTSSCCPWTQMPFSSCSPRLSSSALCWPLPLQERGSRNTHIFPMSHCTLLYVPVLGLSIVHRIGQHTSPLVHILMGKVSVLFHPWWILFNFSIKMQ